MAETVVPEMTARRLRDFEAVHGYVGRVCFKNGPPHQVGAELEWLVAPRSNRQRHVRAEDIEQLIHNAVPLPGGSRITVEPGGQVELSSPVAPDLTSCCRLLSRDTDRLQELLASLDLAVVPVALDPWRPPTRLVVSPRYDAMQVYFEPLGSAGLLMMTSTAAVQVNLDAGADATDVTWRWILMHAVGPTLVAAFANSPVHLGRPTGWKSTRQRIWQQLDLPHTSTLPGVDAVSAWADFALEAPLMMVRRPGAWLPAPGFTFREWLIGVPGFPPPTEDDLAYHLTTLFPPVRPRGWLEVRYIDAQPMEFWPVPIAVLTALIEDHQASEQAFEATAQVRGRWRNAAQLGLTDRLLARAAQRCFEAALDALPRLGAEPDLVGLVERFVQRYVARGRSPADDILAGLSSPDRVTPLRTEASR
jgi:glutamate--cysteine ligase